ncbi:MAG TPA: DUF6584 family protein [Abditibacteriaceae bacterium]|jgi:hypothetical protein
MRTRVDDEIKAGRLWRAKERLSSVVGQIPYDAKVYEELGYVLLLMNDLPEAGKYLFVSGARKPEYQEAIALFLERHGRHGWQQLVSQFPKRAKSLRRDQFPETVQSTLRDLEMPSEHGQELPAYAKPKTMRDNVLGFCGVVVSTIAIIFLGVVFWTGFATLFGSR